MPERSALEAVLLDAGGTLVRLDFEWMAESLAELAPNVSEAALRRAEIEGRRRYDATTRNANTAEASPQPLGSRGDARAYFAGMLEAVGIRGALKERALEIWSGRQSESGLWTRPMEGACEALDGLARLGLRRAVVSNSDGRAEMHIRNCGLIEQVEFVIDSHHVGVEKPDPVIFRKALERLDVAAERALFVGDIRSVDEAGARSAGMRFVLLDPYRDYAAPGQPAIDGMHQLVAWVADRFAVPERPAESMGTRNVAADQAPGAEPQRR
jgi:putative hydrolase of the HAD superfamily